MKQKMKKLMENNFLRNAFIFLLLCFTSMYTACDESDNNKQLPDISGDWVFTYTYTEDYQNSGDKDLTGMSFNIDATVEQNGPDITISFESQPEGIVYSGYVTKGNSIYYSSSCSGSLIDPESLVVYQCDDTLYSETDGAITSDYTSMNGEYFTINSGVKEKAGITWTADKL